MFSTNFNNKCLIFGLSVQILYHFMLFSIIKIRATLDVSPASMECNLS